MKNANANANVKVVQHYVPWYSDDYRISSRGSETFGSRRDYRSLTPQDIYKELTKYVVDQDDACRKVSVMVYQHLRGHRFVGMLAGPTGSGKSFIAESLKKLLPNLVFIRDVSNVSCDGWTGNKKVSDLFRGVDVSGRREDGFYPIIFLDECDKMFKPKHTSGGDNVSEDIQSEFLTVIHGGEMLVTDPTDRRSKTPLNTSNISFLFAGAFENKAAAIAEKESGPSLGFGASMEKVNSYNRELTIDDVIEAGCMRELAGRIQRLVNLNPFGEEAFRRMLDDHERGPLGELENEFEIPICISESRKDEIAHDAYASGLGIRGIKNSIREYIDEMMWNDCNARVLEIA